MALIRLIVEIDDADPVRGRIGPPGGPMQSFSGWTGFAAAIELARTDQQDAPQPPLDHSAVPQVGCENGDESPSGAGGRAPPELYIREELS